MGALLAFLERERRGQGFPAARLGNRNILLVCLFQPEVLGVRRREFGELVLERAVLDRRCQLLLEIDLLPAQAPQFVGGSFAVRGACREIGDRTNPRPGGLDVQRNGCALLQRFPAEPAPLRPGARLGQRTDLVAVGIDSVRPHPVQGIDERTELPLGAPAVDPDQAVAAGVVEVPHRLPERRAVAIAAHVGRYRCEDCFQLRSLTLHQRVVSDAGSGADQTSHYHNSGQRPAHQWYPAHQ